MSGVTVTTTVNGDPVQYVCPADESLLDDTSQPVKHDRFQRRLWNRGLWRLQYHHGWPACLFVLVLGAEAEGRTIETVEGLSEGGELHRFREVH